MQRSISIFGLVLMFSLGVFTVHAGNEDRIGQNGGHELMINPWPRLGGWHGVNTANVTGIEAMRNNVAGLIGTNSLELKASTSKYLLGTGIDMSAFGFAKTLNDEGTDVMSVTVSSFNIGEVERTTYDQPGGGIGTFNPNVVNIAAGYAKRFSNAIKGGAVVRMLSESLSDATASGVAIDAGIQYSTNFGDGETNTSHFGVSLRNIGTPMQYSGNGLSNRATIQGNDFAQTMQARSNSFELPSLLNIGLSQDFYFSDDEVQKLTIAGNFTSNSFSKDQYKLGAQYSLNEIIEVRSGLLYETGIFDQEGASTHAYSGPSAGFTVNVPFEDRDETEGHTKKISLDYSVRMTKVYDGVHSIGLSMDL